MHGLNSIQDAVSSINKGEMVIVVDSEERENEGDLVCAAEKIIPSQVNFMAKEGRGLICAPLSEKIADRLDLPLMVSKNTENTKCNFTVSVDLKEGTTTGISASDRCKTIRAIANPKTSKDDLLRPGHIFPIRSKKGGVLVRAGHTEAATDIAKLAGLEPCAAICEITREDGEMARLPYLLNFAKKHDIKIVSITDLIKYRHRKERLVKKISQSKLSTDYGDFKKTIYRDVINNIEHVALTKGEINGKQPVFVRVHSECITGDVFHSTLCNCQKQLSNSLELIQKYGKGIFVYIKHKSQKDDSHKIKHCHSQEEAIDHVVSTQKVSIESSLKEYGIGAQILNDLGVKKIKLLSDNPKKIVGLQGYGLQINDVIPLILKPYRNRKTDLNKKTANKNPYLERV